MQFRGRVIPVWVLPLLIVMLIALIVRAVGYNFSLPYVDHPDEPNKYLLALEWRGLFNWGNSLQGYPPLYIWLTISVEAILGRFGLFGLASVVQALRLIALGFGLVTFLCIVVAARSGGGWLAGIVAGAAWAVAPLVVENATYAIQDPMVYMFVSAALCLAAVALVDPKRAHWCVWSVAAGGLAIMAKYPVVTAVLPGLAVTLLVYRKDRARAWRYLRLQILLLIITAAVTLPGYAVLHNVEGQERGGFIRNILTPSRVLNNLYAAILPLNPPFFLITLVLAIAAFGMARQNRRVRADVVALCLLVLISVPWLAAAFSVDTPLGRMRDVLPATTAACVLLGLSVEQIVRLLPRLLRVIVVIAPLVLVFAPQVSADAAIMQDRVKPDSRVVLRRWADVNLTPGTMLVGSVNAKTFNPLWGGIEGQHWFDWYISDDFTAKTPRAWHQQNGINYMVMDYSQWQEMQSTVAGQAYLAPMLPLDTFDLPGYRGPQMVVLRLWPIQHPTQVTFGSGINLLGYDLDGSAVAPGGTVTLTFYWRATTPPSDNYSAFVHEFAQGGSAMIAQADGAPARAERPTLSWTDTDETLISQPFTLTIPPDTPSGLYDLHLGLYNYQSGARLPINAAALAPDDAYLLVTITVL